MHFHTLFAHLRVVWPLAACAAVAGAALLVPARHRPLALGLAAALDSFVLARRMIAAPPSRVFALPAIVPRPSVNERVLGVPFDVLHPNTGMIWDVPDVREVAGLPIARVVDFFGAVKSPDRFFTTQSPLDPANPLADRTADRWVLVSKAQPMPARPSLVERARDDRVVVFENTAALPRARLVHDVVTTSSEREALAALSPDRTVVEGDVAVEPATGDEVAIVRAAPERVEITTRSTGAGLLVLADAYYPGWRATVDGAPASIYPADVAFRGVPVPAGEHRVVFTYRSTPLRAGAILSLLGLIAIVSIWVRMRP
jgi:hypothetical protein